MPYILFCKMFSNEHVSKVCSAFGAAYFCAFSVWIRFFCDCTWDFFFKAWPSAVGFELVFGVVQRRAAAFADVGTFFPERKEFSREGCFSGFVDYYAFLFLG